MAKIKTIAFDTMCVIYFLDDHPRYAHLAERLFKQIHLGQIIGCTSIITKIELLSSPTLIQQSELKDKYINFFKRLNNFHTHALTEELVQSTADLRKKYGFKLPDAVQIATALTFNADYFLTNDHQLIKTTEIHTVSFDQLDTLLNDH